MNNHKEKKKPTPPTVETTGHEWDGIKEFNNPAPRWWLLVFIICIVWSFGYWVLYPSWPTISSHLHGEKQWTEYKKLASEQAEITKIRGELGKKLAEKSLNDIEKDPTLYNFALAGGKTIFKENCAACHGSGAQGGNGYPNLNDDDWLWGGTLQDIYTTIKYGIRSSSEETRTSQMPAFGGGILTQSEISDIAEYVLSLSGGSPSNAKGEALFQDNCTSCHGKNGHGDHAFGAPNLSDAIWLYGNKKENIMSQINKPRHGIMPTWEHRLPDEVIKELSIYVYSLGGGERPKNK